MLSETSRLSQMLSQVQNHAGQRVGQLGDLTLSSHFQPIYSLSHARVVGHEALLRATDAAGRAVPPPVVFDDCKTPDELAHCDRLSRIVHILNFASQNPASQWVFLNVHPHVLQRLTRRADGGDSYMRDLGQKLGLAPDRMVLEVLETEVSDFSAVEAAMATVRKHGCLIAIDDFGAGHSNFDRVWRMQPDIVKLDRSLVARAARDRRAQRVVSQMVSLLHECGAMVLMEGVETLDEALLAMESDADMVQGYYFGRPQPRLVPDGHSPETITGLYSGLGARRDLQRTQNRHQVAPFQHAIGNAGVLMSAGVPAADACRDFLALPGAEICYVLDADGYQIGDHLLPESLPDPTLAAYAPLSDSAGACWARRPYFRRATEAIGKVHTTRPYRTMRGHHVCITASYAYFHIEGGQRHLRVVCGDLVWNEPQMPFGDTP